MPLAAFIEWKTCPECGAGNHFGNIRVGENCDKWSAPYDARCNVDNTGDLAVIEAYAGAYSEERRNVVIGLVNRETGKRVLFDRLVPGRPAVTYVQSETGPFGEGKIIMHVQKMKAPHAGRDTKKDAHGKPDPEQVEQVTLAMIEQRKAGHYTYDAMGQVNSANGSRDDEKTLMAAMRGMKPNQKLIWLLRGEADTTNPGTEPPAAA